MYLLYSILIVIICCVHGSVFDDVLGTISERTSVPEEAVSIARRICSENKLCGNCIGNVALQVFDSTSHKVSLGTKVTDEIFEVIEEEVCMDSACSADTTSKTILQNNKMKRFTDVTFKDETTNKTFAFQYPLFPPVNPWKFAIDICVEAAITSNSCVQLALYLQDVSQGCHQ